MSATIHTVSAAKFRNELDGEARLTFLAEVGSEFLATTGRGRNIKPVFAMPDSYAALFARRVRQAAAIEAGVKPSKVSAEQVDATTQALLALAKEVAASAR